MKLDDLPDRYQDQVRPQLSPVGQLALPGKPGVLIASDAVEEESALHEDIRKLCALKGWLPLHGSMAHKTYRTPGEWDFVILAEWPRLFLIECKDREGKVTKEQAAISAWAAKLGWKPTVCRSMTEVLAYVETRPPSAPPSGSVIRRDPQEAVDSHRREGWENGAHLVRAIFTAGDHMRLVMMDGRSGDVIWDTTPNRAGSATAGH